MMLFRLSVLVCCLWGIAGGNTKQKAHVLVHQRLESTLLAQGQPFQVRYTFVNVGKLAAKDIELSLPSWPIGAFEQANAKPGVPSLSIDSIESGKSVERVLTLKPKVPTQLEPPQTISMVQYLDGASKNKIKGWTLGFGKLDIVSARAYTRLVSSYKTEWTQFVLISFWTWLVPFLVAKASNRALRIHLSNISTE